jgi:hypothetical protein
MSRKAHQYRLPFSASNLLQQLLLQAMPPMSNGLAKDLFGKSLSSFAAKINLAGAPTEAVVR